MAHYERISPGQDVLPVVRSALRQNALTDILESQHIRLGRRQVGAGGGGGKSGASEIFVCTLETGIDPSIAADGSDMQDAPGTVYEILSGGILNELGTRTIHNPYRSVLPEEVNSLKVQYTCDKTFAGTSENDDEFTIVGLDPFWLFASLQNYGPGKLLMVNGLGADDMEWAGDCQQLVTEVACEDGQLMVTDAHYIVINCTPN
jgi:hypothetical protein